MRRWSLLWLALLPGVGLAQSPPLPCVDSDALPEGPIGLGYYEADVATAHRTCPRTEVALAGRAGAVIDTPAFYGAIAADALLSASAALDPRTELFGTLEALHYQYAQNATLKGGNLSLGELTLGASRVDLETARIASASVVRLLLPTSTATPHAHLVGAELGQSLTFRATVSLELHGYLGADFAAALSEGPAFPRGGAVLVLGAQWMPWGWLGLALDGTARVGSTTFVAPTLAVRARAGHALGFELAASAPLFGSDRHDGLLALRVSWRLP